MSENPIGHESMTADKIDHINETENVSDLANNLLLVATYLIDCAHRINVNQGNGQSENHSIFSWDSKVSHNYLNDDFLCRSATKLYGDRRKRDIIFENIEIFGEPAWDILIDLFKSEKLGTRVSVTSCCIAAAVPPTTALRWISVLVDEGLVHREDDEFDSRRTYVRLTKRAIDLLGRYFCETASGGIFALQK